MPYRRPSSDYPEGVERTLRHEPLVLYLAIDPDAALPCGTNTVTAC